MSQPKTVFEWNGASYEFFSGDADCAERLETAVENMTKAEKTIPKVGKSSEIIRGQCKLIKDFFDDVLGKGAGVAICTERNDVQTHYDAYVAFISLVSEQNKSIHEMKNRFIPENREQRIAADKAK